MLVREGDLQRAQAAGELLHCARADDRRGDGGLVQQPGQGDIGGMVAAPGTELLVALQLRAGVLANTVDFMTGPFRGDEGEAVKAAINEVHIQFAIENPTLSNALSLLIFFVHTQMDGTKFYATLGYCVSVGDLMNTQGSAPGPYIIPTW